MEYKPPLSVMRSFFLVALALAFLACERRTPQMPSATPSGAPAPAPSSIVGASALEGDGGPPSAPIAVPRGCEVNLSGRYHLLGRSAARYAVTDDGVHLMLHALGEDAGAKEMALVMDRTPQGFVGLVVGNAKTDGGPDCPVAFSAALTSCSAEGIVVRSVDELEVDERCRLRESAEAISEKVLVRE